MWDVLTSSDHHLNAHEITQRVHAQDPGINISSIYRTLALFAEIDLVRESRLGDEAFTWEPAHGDAVIHLVCTQCGTVQHHHTTMIDSLRRELIEAKFTPDSIDIRVNGYCERCSQVGVRTHKENR